MSKKGNVAFTHHNLASKIHDWLGVVKCGVWHKSHSDVEVTTVRSGAEERTFSGARLDVLIFRLRSYHVLNHVHCTDGKWPKSHKHMMLVQAGTFLCFQARRSSASDLTVVPKRMLKY